MDDKIDEEEVEQILSEAKAFSPNKEWRRLAAMGIVVLREIRNELAGIRHELANAFRE